MSAPPTFDGDEITDEMISVGAAILDEFSIDLSDGTILSAEVAEKVYYAMRQARPSILRATP